MEIEDKVYKVVRKCISDKALKVAPAQNLKMDLGLDSMGLVELVVELEAEFDIVIEDDDTDCFSLQ